MSRFKDEGEPADYPNAGDLWEANARRALSGKRGRKALADLREALLNLPEKRLIERAFCTVGADARTDAIPLMGDPDSKWADWQRRDFRELVKEQGEGVCAVGAYVWWQQVKAGTDPQQAFVDLPTLDDLSASEWETVNAGREAGLTMTLAWELARKNDDDYEGMTAEERYDAFLSWIDKQLAEPVPA